MSQKIHSPHEASIINALQFQGNTNDCAPFTIATIVNAFSGLSTDGAALAKKMNKPIWHGIFPVIRRIPNWATFPWGVVDVLKEFGFLAHWGFRSNSDFLRLSIQKGNLPIPIIGSWRPLFAHVMTCVAWDSDGLWGFANTQISEKKIDWIPEDYFNKHWNSYGKMFIEVKLA
ncbi:MAG: hypothetical protein JW908_09880 [Anaerolineales bacterium]|nr:hypothetical protein [Anaerolineales bacterium]